MYLKAWYEHAKTNVRGFSHRSFSQKAGFSSPNVLKRVMDGSRSLTDTSIAAFVKALKLSRTEADFFKHMVLFNQAKTHEEKDYHYRHLIRSKAIGHLKTLECDQYDYYSVWYHAVIRELIVSPEWDGRFESIAKKIFPSLKVEDVKASVELLKRLGMIRLESKTKRYIQCDAVITTGAEATQVSLHNYHQSVLKLVSVLLPRLPAENRDVSVLTLGIKKGRFEEIKAMVQNFRRELLRHVADDTTPEEVCLLAMQLVPVVK